ncbi:MAG: pyridoxamine kinase [Eubacterium sp.]|nr:pyridoxamine kinase [Eubacterium sp.]
MKKIAVINDISGFGKCSLTAAIPVITAHGIQPCPLPTGVFSNQTGYESYKGVDLTSSMQDFIDEWKKLGVGFDGILTGFIPNSLQGEIISRFIDDFKGENTVVLVDPIMGDDGEIYDTYNEKSIEAVISLSEKADIITPNVTELALLCKKDIKKAYSPDEIKEMSASLNNEYVITTGINLGERIANAVYCKDGFRLIEAERLGQHFSGTGDIFSAYVLSDYLSGKDIFASVKNACEFIEKAIKLTLENESEKHYHPDGTAFETLLQI